MNPTELDVFVPGQVESRSSITADLGGGRSLVVLSGIACPEYNAVDDEQREATWRVLERAAAVAGIAIADYQGYAAEPGADAARAIADLTELARVVLDSAGLTEAARAAREAAERIGQVGHGS